MDPPKRMKLTAECSTSSTPGPSTSNVANSITPKPKLRVLSLFDGIGSGLLALEKLGLDIEVYFASEIDPDALKVTASNFGMKIIQLGSVKDIDDEKLDELGEINLLIGGSPCNDLSLVNHRGKGLFDTEGTGHLFFEYYRIWNTLKQKNNLFYWLYENVFHMEVVNRSVISKFLSSNYFILDSLTVSPQRRKRLFWSNLPGLRELEVQLSEADNNSGPQLDEFLDKNLGRKANYNKCNTLTTKYSCLQNGSTHNPVNGENPFLYTTEIEAIFGLPLHFTDVADLSARKRLKLLGKSWSIPVIVLIFKPLTEIFRLKENNK